MSANVCSTPSAGECRVGGAGAGRFRGNPVAIAIADNADVAEDNGGGSAGGDGDDDEVCTFAAGAVECFAGAAVLSSAKQICFDDGSVGWGGFCGRPELPTDAFSVVAAVAIAAVAAGVDTVDAAVAAGVDAVAAVAAGVDAAAAVAAGVDAVAAAIAAGVDAVAAVAAGVDAVDAADVAAGVTADVAAGVAADGVAADVVVAVSTA